VGRFIVRIPLDQLRPNGSQPRQTFDEGALADLAANMREVGQLQPIVVRPVNGGYQIVAGERRWRAAQKLQWPDLEAVVAETDDDRALVMAVAENAAREDLNPMEEAKALAALQERGFSTSDIGIIAGLPPSQVTWRIELLQLRPELQHLIARGQLAPTAGWYLAKLSLNGQLRAARQLATTAMDTDQVAAMAGVIYAEETQGQMFPETKLTPEAIKAAAAWRAALDRAVTALDKAQAAGEGVLGEALAHELDVADEKIGYVIRGFAALRRDLKKRRTRMQTIGGRDGETN
jgi:ParB family chromosome partitioning protein